MEMIELKFKCPFCGREMVHEKTLVAVEMFYYIYRCPCDAGFVIQKWKNEYYNIYYQYSNNTPKNARFIKSFLQREGIDVWKD